MVDEGGVDKPSNFEAEPIMGASSGAGFDDGGTFLGGLTLLLLQAFRFFGLSPHSMLPKLASKESPGSKPGKGLAGVAVFGFTKVGAEDEDGAAGRPFGLAPGMGAAGGTLPGAELAGEEDEGRPGALASISASKKAARA